jgi:phosphohistidine phosphatase
MKVILLLRHAKSSWDEPVNDHDRPLTKRGKEAALRAGEEIRYRGLVPDLILSSTARRARKTAKRVAKSSGYPGEIVLVEDLYDSDVPRHLEVISETRDVHDRILVVGHNPVFEELVFRLSDERVRLPTAAIARIDLDLESWASIGEATGKLELILPPDEEERGS